MATRSVRGRAWLAVAGAALATLGVAAYRRPFATARALRRWRLLAGGVAERRATVRGVPVRYLAAGPSDGALVVLLHGLGDAAETWAGVLPRLARDYRVVAPDLAGFGRTPIPPEGMRFSVLADYLAGFLDAIDETAKAGQLTLVGNSLGGAVAIRHAARHPGRVARLFLLDTAGLPFGDLDIFSPRTRAAARKLVEVSYGEQLRLPGFLLDDLIRRVDDPARSAYLASPEHTDVADDLDKLTMPLTLIWGERDRLIPVSVAERIRTVHPGAELIVLPKAGHLPQSTAPREIAAIIRERLGMPGRRG